MIGQNLPSTKVDFKNASVLFKEDGKSFQQVIASYHSEKPAKIVFTKGGKELLNADLIRGENKFLLTLPAVTKETKIDITTKY